MYKALFLSPMIPSFDVQKTAAFFSDCLGFTVRILESQYAICTKDHLTLHLLPAGKDIGQVEFYLEVDNVDALWEAIKNKIGHLTTRGPFDREYGMREIHIGVPETNALLFIGQSLRSGA